MQNLDTVHREDIAQRNEIALPAGHGRSAFIDVADIGAVAAQVLTENGHAGKAYALTGPQALDFDEVAAILSDELGHTITYRSPSPWRFVAEQRSRGRPLSLALVMTALYTVQRFGLAAEMTREVERVLGRPATDLRTYAERVRRSWSAG